VSFETDKVLACAISSAVLNTASIECSLCCAFDWCGILHKTLMRHSKHLYCRWTIILLL